MVKSSSCIGNEFVMQFGVNFAATETNGKIDPVSDQWKIAKCVGEQQLSNIPAYALGQSSMNFVDES